METALLLFSAELSKIKLRHISASPLMIVLIKAADEEFKKFMFYCFHLLKMIKNKLVANRTI